jgi:hypothetical protein
MAEKKIRITAGRVTADAVLNASTTAAAVWDALPLDVPGETWGDEIYFSTALVAPSNAGQGVETVSMGAIGYWPPGQALCLFFGPTPMSRGDEIRPASAVHLIGMLEGDPKVLKKVAAGASIAVEIEG